MRTFIALDLPEDIRLELSKVKKPLEQHPGLNIVEDKNLHCTLIFLGDQPDENIDIIKSILEQNTKSLSPITCQVRSFGVFPDNRYPKVIWVGLETKNILESFENSIESVLIEKKIIPPPKNSFLSHITLARVKYIRSSEEKKELIGYILKNRDYATRSFLIDAVSLKKSILTPSGPVYSDIAKFRFGKDD